MDVRTCPVCFEPLNGLVCSNCETDTREVETVRCDSCGRKVAKSEAVEERKQKQYSARWVTDYYCPECK